MAEQSSNARKHHPPFGVGDSTTNTTKYYASREVSTQYDAQRFAPNRRGRSGQPPAAPAVRAFASDDTSTGKYYAANYKQRALTEKPARVAFKSPRTPQDTAVPMPGVVSVLQLKARADLQGVVEAVVRRAAMPAVPRIIVQASPELQNLLLVQLDLAVAREQISAERYRDIRVEVMPASTTEAAARAFGAVVAAAVPVGVETAPAAAKADEIMAALEAVVEPVPGLTAAPEAESEEPAVPADDEVPETDDE